MTTQNKKKIEQLTMAMNEFLLYRIWIRWLHALAQLVPIRDKIKQAEKISPFLRATWIFASTL